METYQVREYTPTCRFLEIIYRSRLRFQQYFSYIVAVRFIGGGNRSTGEIPGPITYFIT